MASPPNFIGQSQNPSARYDNFVKIRTYPKKENKIIIVYNLKPTTSKRTIRKVFEKFGFGFRPKVTFKMNIHGQPDGSATVAFDRRPRYLDITRPLLIDDQAVKMEHGMIISEHERPTYFKAMSLTLGIMLTETEFVEEWSIEERVKLEVHYEKECMNVEFKQSRVFYRMEIKFGDIDSNNVVVENIDSATYLTIPLTRPPKVSQVNSRTPHRLTTIPFTVETATTTTSHDESCDTYNTPTQIHATTNNVRLEIWNVFRIKFDIQQKSDKKWLRNMLAGMADYNLVPREILLNTDELLKITPAADLPVPKTHQERAQLLAFDVLYHLECNLSANYLMERNLDDSFYDRLSSHDPVTACGMLTLMGQNKTRVWDPTKEMDNIFKAHGTEALRKLGRSYLRKLIITPTTIQCKLLPPENANRVLQHYKKYKDRFIRVQFTDEDMMRLGPAFGISSRNNALYSRVYQTLMNGIQVGTRQYDYLGYSSSQLREQGCWFYAAKDAGSELPLLNADMIRSWMGDFSDIKIVAKYAARMGQYFSSIKATLPLTKKQVTCSKDIVVGKYTFSDGAGNISPELAEKIKCALSLRVLPSAFQFRLGGAKGVLVVSNKLKGCQVELRKSQIKFDSDDYKLGIIGTSSFTPVFLNRQAITILSTLGVKNEIFMAKLKAVLRSLNDMFKRPGKAINVLQGYPDRSGIASFMTMVIKAGFLKRQDPFIKNLLNMVRLRTLKNLKEKAKLSVKKGAFVFGVLDESGDLDKEGVLKEGEIFCQVTNSLESKKTKVITGQCIVYRNPCFHPGDIRVVTAVDRSKTLGHLENVVVFPRAGERDIPSMCSGGDLDGDKYTIIWDKELIPETINHAPMDYTPPDPSDLRTKSNVTMDDIKEFFVDYIKSDNLGQIANAHLATADYSKHGAKDPHCLKLAELHSLAVDFAKTGNPAIMESDLMVDRYPDFMCKLDKRSYVSPKALGEMFRLVNKINDDKYESRLEGDSIHDTRLWVRGMERYIANARRSLMEYNQELSGLMKKHGVKTEAEMISGFVMTWSNGCNEKADYESQIQAAKAVKKLRDDWKKKFYQEFENTIKKAKANSTKNQKRKNNNKLSRYSTEMKSDVDAKAAAWYYVTYHPTERRLVTNEEGYFSFAWMAVKVLVQLGQRPINQQQKDEIMKAVNEDLIREYPSNTSSDDTHGDESSVDDNSNHDTYEGSDGGSFKNNDVNDILAPISDLAVGEHVDTSDSE